MEDGGMGFNFCEIKILIEMHLPNVMVKLILSGGGSAKDS